jgi:hypothetical protein
MSKRKLGCAARDRQPAVTPDDVYNAICTLAESVPALPTQAMIADHLNCSQQLVSVVMRMLSDPRDGRIRWLSNRLYYVDKSRWERPENADISSRG